MKNNFKTGEWEKVIDVRDFLYHNQTPYSGGTELLKGKTKKTQELWDICKGLLKKDFSWYEPYHSNFNVKLGQLPNIPLFIDELKPDTLLEIFKEIIFRRTVNEVSNMGFRDLINKGVNAIKRNPSLLKYVFSPRFYCTYLFNKIKSF